jgi:RNA polymerase sigma factor (sigma-70 family)
MSSHGLHAVLRYLRRVTGRDDVGQTDTALLERFVAGRDEAAFELLLWRHGGMVLSVCRSVLGRSPDVEDAFQATFLLLASRAGSISKREAVGSWLYKVAYRVALRARAEALRRPRQAPADADLPAPEPPEDLVWRDLRPVLDEEVSRLPEKYRAAVVLCYLEGRTYEEAARQIGCPRGTVAVRLKRGRELLRVRLTRRGLGPVAGLVAAGTPGSAPSVSAALVQPTLRAALGYVAGNTTAGGAASVPAVALAEGVLRTMSLVQLKTATAIFVLVVGLLGGGTTIVLRHAPATQPAKAGEVAVVPTAKGANRDEVLVNIPSQVDGVLAVVGTEIKEGEKVAPGRILTVKIGGGVKKYRRLREGDAVVEGQLLARVDDRLARDEVQVRKAKVEAAQAELRAANKIKEEYAKRYENMERARKRTRNAFSDDDLRAAKLTREQYTEEAVAKAARVRAAQAELHAAEAVVMMHEIRSSVGGVIKNICKHRGEAVRNLETVFVIRAGEARPKPATTEPEAAEGRERQEVPAERDGKLMFLGTEIRPGETVPAEQIIKAEVGFVVVAMAPGEKVPREQQLSFPGDPRKYRR